MTKKEWKKLYRTMRVIRRESSKVIKDMMMLGTGVIMIPNDGSDPKRIHPKEIILYKGDER